MTNKLPIPRIPHERRAASGRRISRACDACRARKAKCDGNRPRCAQCTAQGLDKCLYSDRKLVRLQKDFESEQGKREAYEGFLRDLSVEFEGPIADRIDKFLKRNPRTGDSKHRRQNSNASSASSMGSLDDVDVASEDFNRDEKSRATGYMGKNSEVVWMQRLGLEATRQYDDKITQPQSSLQCVPHDSLSSTNYHLDDRSLRNRAVPNAFALPSKALSDELFRVYLDKVQPSLPLIRRDLFCAQYDHCYLDRLNPGRKWLAILNIIFAIGSAILRLSGEEVPDISEDVFFTRAKILSVSENMLYQHDDLQQVQFESLMAFYFLTISQINRSWKMIGIAARSGISLGMNLHKKHDGLDADSEEARKQLWWSIFRLEHLLSVMTGRVSCIGSASSSLPPPLPLPSLAHTGFVGQQRDDVTHSQLRNLCWTMQTNPKITDIHDKLLRTLHPSPSLYHFYMVDLSLIAHAISSGVYSTQSNRIDWGRIENRISVYNKRMDHWVSRLNPAFHFQDNHGNLLHTIESAFQISLAMSYYSTRIILNRPCLNRPAFEKAGKASGKRLPRSRFSNLSALACLQASLAIIKLLPDQVSLKWSYELLQWWDFVHVLTQATVILLLDISVGPVPTKLGEAHVVSEPTGDVLKAAKKGIRWLQCLGNTSGAAHRSFEFANKCIHSLTVAREFDLSDMPPVAHQTYQTRSTKEEEENSSAQSGRPGSEAEKDMPGDFAPSESPSSERNARDQLPPTGMQQRIPSLYDCDVDLPDVTPELQNPQLEDLLLSMMAS